MIRFAVVLLFAALILGALTAVAQNQMWIDHLPSFFFQTLIFLVFTTFTIFVYLYKINKPDLFVRLYLLTMVVKFLAYGAYNFIMITEDKADAAENVVFFMILYVVFTGLEIAFLHRKISNTRR